MEIAVGITCGNLPLMRPLFRRFFESTGSTSQDSRYFTGGSRPSRIVGQTDISRTDPKQTYRGDGFERMDEESLGDASDIELNDHRYRGDGIVVTTNVHIKEEQRDSPLDFQAIISPMRDVSTASVDASRPVQAGKRL